MEKIISQEDRIRRAEEIYYKRNNLNTRQIGIVNDNSKKTYRLLKKTLIQIVICIGLYMGVFYLQEDKGLIKLNGVEYVRKMLEYDVNINECIMFMKNELNLNMMYVREKLNNNGLNIQEEGKKEANTNDNSNNNNDEKENENNDTLNSNLEEKTESIIRQEESVQANDVEDNKNKANEDENSLNKMEQDAKYIKDNFSLIKPITGTITSRFGNRNPTTPTVPKFHTGIDIAVNEGTVFIASMEGTVELVSSEGDYGNHVKITNKDVTTLYAHCKTIYVKEGEKVIQGQQIGETGSTGNVTGPHLHFEIRRNDEYVDPDLILDF